MPIEDHEIEQQKKMQQQLDSYKQQQIHYQQPNYQQMQVNPVHQQIPNHQQYHQPQYYQPVYYYPYPYYHGGSIMYSNPYTIGYPNQKPPVQDQDQYYKNPTTFNSIEMQR